MSMARSGDANADKRSGSAVGEGSGAAVNNAARGGLLGALLGRRARNIEPKTDGLADSRKEPEMGRENIDEWIAVIRGGASGEQAKQYVLYALQAFEPGSSEFAKLMDGLKFALAEGAVEPGFVAGLEAFAGKLGNIGKEAQADALQSISDAFTQVWAAGSGEIYQHYRVYSARKDFAGALACIAELGKRAREDSCGRSVRHLLKIVREREAGDALLDAALRQLELAARSHAWSDEQPEQHGKFEATAKVERNLVVEKLKALLGAGGGRKALDSAMGTLGGSREFLGGLVLAEGEFEELKREAAVIAGALEAKGLGSEGIAASLGHFKKLEGYFAVPGMRGIEQQLSRIRGKIKGDGRKRLRGIRNALSRQALMDGAGIIAGGEMSRLEAGLLKLQTEAGGNSDKVEEALEELRKAEKVAGLYVLGRDGKDEVMSGLEKAAKALFESEDGKKALLIRASLKRIEAIAGAAGVVDELGNEQGRREFENAVYAALEKGAAAAGAGEPDELAEFSHVPAAAARSAVENKEPLKDEPAKGG